MRVRMEESYTLVDCALSRAIYSHSWVQCRAFVQSQSYLFVYCTKNLCNRQVGTQPFINESENVNSILNSVN